MTELLKDYTPPEEIARLVPVTSRAISREGKLTNIVLNSTGNATLTIDTSFAAGDMIDISIISTSSVITMSASNRIYGLGGIGGGLQSTLAINGLGTHRFACRGSNQWVYLGSSDSSTVSEGFRTPFTTVDLTSSSKTEVWSAAETSVLNASSSARTFTASGTWPEGAKINVHKKKSAGTITLNSNHNFQSPDGSASTQATFTNDGSVTIQMISGTWRIIASVAF